MNTSLKKVIWIILCGILVLSTVIARFQLRRGKTLQQEVADTRRMLREQGFKTELADFNVTTDPLTRTRAAALTVFENWLLLGAFGGELDFLPRVSDGTASVVWKLDALPIGHGVLQWPGLHAVLDTNREALDAACAAAVSGPIRFDVNFRDFDSHVAQHLLPLRYLSLNLSDRVMLELHDGNLDAAWTNLLSATRLATEWEPDPAAVSHQIHSMLTEVAFQDGWQALQNRNWPDQKLAALQQEWAAANFFTNVPEANALSRLQAVPICRSLSQRKAFFSFSFPRFAGQAIRHPSAAFSEFKDQINIMRYRGNEALIDEKNLLLLFRDRELEVRQATQSPTWAEMRAQPGVTNLIAFHSICREMMVDVKSCQQFECMVCAYAARAEAQRRIIVTAIALERYRGKHGAYPATLDSLAPEFLKGVPVDFMDGQPLRYRLTNDGHFVLYSVGLDCVDDGGKLPLSGAPIIPTDDDENYIAPTNVDIVWPRPAVP